MPEIKHQVDIYFNLRARGESCRLLLAYGGLQYEDERLPPAKLKDPSVEEGASNQPTEVELRILG